MFSQKKLKELLKLKNKKFRKEKKRFTVEGIRSVEELISSDWKADLLLYSVPFEKSDKAKTILQKAKKKGMTIEKVNQNILDKISDTIASAGVVCVVETKSPSLDNLLKREPKTILALDEIKDPGNLGTLIRTADAAGIDGIILSERTVELYSPKVVRSSMGSIFHILIVEKVDLTESVSRLKESGFRILASAVKIGEPYDKINYSGKVCLIIGSEIQGVKSEVLKSADQIVNIPLYGKAESLNASVAGGILMYQMVKDDNGDP